MAEEIPPDEQSNFESFRECLSEPVLRTLAAPVEKPKKKRKERHRKKGSKGSNHVVETPAPDTAVNGTVNGEEDTGGSDAEDLGDFIDYLSTLLFTSLPAPLRTLTYAKWKEDAKLQAFYSVPLSTATTNTLISSIHPLAIENLESYGILPSPSDDTDLRHFAIPIIESYLSSATAPPPVWSSTRTDYCELCHRSWIPLTYHHLIPKSTHDRVLKRGWHTEDKLDSVAWLCRACHSFVHKAESNESLARDWYTIELLQGREDVQNWVKWVGRVRWRSR